jgi:hypothetical protein
MQISKTMPDYNKIAAKNKDIDNIKNGVTVRSITESRNSQNAPNAVRQKFMDYSENASTDGEKSKTLRVQKDSKAKEYFYKESPSGEKQMQKRVVSSSGKERTRIIEGDKAERKMNRVVKRSI